VLAFKAVRQNYRPTDRLLELLETFRRMVNECVTIGLANEAWTLKRLSLLSYGQLSGYNCPSYYKLCAISRAAGILASRRKSLKRGIVPKSPYSTRPQLVSCYRFKVKDAQLHIPIGNREHERIRLNPYTLRVLADPSLKTRSFLLTPNTLSITVAKQVIPRQVVGTAGLDRNLSNLTYGNLERVIQYDLSKTIAIAHTTRSTVSTFCRNDARIRQRISAKYGQRRSQRTLQLLHHATKSIVADAVQHSEAIILEKITEIRRLYRKGNGQGNHYRAMMNAWSFGEAKRQIEYKASWEGVPVFVVDPRGTSNRCAKCGEILQVAQLSDTKHRRSLWCNKCQRWIDRDVNAVVNLSLRGRLRFDRSEGTPGEAMVEEPEQRRETVILKVDGAKSSHQPKT
jgi:putative transposase